jgi:mannose-6-phosphate isomerase-like protein (cupin superfamily)
MNRDVKIVPKTWGLEAWFYNGDYCGKRLTFAEDHRCSMHYHKNKHETFLIIVGRIFLEYKGIFDSFWTYKMLEMGDTFIISPQAEHRMTAIGGNAAIIEFSSHHEDEDSYRTQTGQVWE